MTATPEHPKGTAGAIRIGRGMVLRGLGPAIVYPARSREASRSRLSRRFFDTIEINPRFTIH